MFGGKSFTKFTEDNMNYLRATSLGAMRSLKCFPSHLTIKATESLILIGSAMFGATFNSVTRVGLP